MTTLLLLYALLIQDFPEPSKLPVHPELPDPMICLDGTKITTKEDWENKRKPELKALIQHYMYGQIPAAPKQVKSEVLYEDKQAFGGKATLKEVALTVGPPEARKIYVLVVVPNKRQGPAPVFIGLNFHGNHSLVDDPHVRLPDVWVPNSPGAKDNRAIAAGRGREAQNWALEQSIDRGYAVVAFYPGDIDPDRPDQRQGLRPYWKRGGEKPSPFDTATIAAWAWGAHRVVDYVLTDKDLDANRIALVGHSRLGKATLLAAAFDDRIALAIPHQAGCGGTAPSRGKVGESVKRINTSFPHWFDGAFKEFNDQPERLPFDQNCLLGLMAPRPVLFSNAVEDTWANPDGQFEVLQAAEPVYRLYSAGGLASKEKPGIGKLSDGTLGYFIRPGVHSMTKLDWLAFLDFADKNLPKKK